LIFNSINKGKYPAAVREYEFDISNPFVYEIVRSGMDAMQEIKAIQK